MTLGDSLSEGGGASDVAHRWVDVMASSLAGSQPYARYVPSWYESPNLAAPATGDVGDTFPLFGPGIRSIWLTPGQHATWTVSGTSIDLMAPKTPPAGSIGVTLDGVAKPSINLHDTVTFDGVAASYDGLAPGPHTITVTCATGGDLGGSVVDGVIAYPAGRSSGIRLIDASHWGIAAADVAPGGYDGASLPTWLEAVAPDLVIVELGANDWLHVGDTGAYGEALGAIADTVQAVSTGPDMMILAAPRVTIAPDSGITASWDSYIAVQQNLASARSAAFLNLDQVLGHASDHPDDYGPDEHPNDAGHLKFANAVGGMLRTAAGL